MANASLQPVGVWLGSSFSQLKHRWLPLTMLLLVGFLATVLSVALVYGLAVVFVGFLRGWDNLGRTLSDPRKLGIFIEQSRGALMMFNLLAGFVALRMYCWYFHAAIHASADASLGVRAALRRGKSRSYGFLALFVVQQIILQLGMLLFILPGIILTVLLGFAMWAFARDEAGVFQSLGHSARMVKGRFLGVFGRMLLVGLIGIPFMIVPVIGWLVGTAWMLVAWSLLYDNLAERERVPAAVAPSPTRPLEQTRAPA